MREAKDYCIVTFHTTMDAIAFEKACKEEDIKGRLIPVPRQISAGCGLAWRADPEHEPLLCQLAEERRLEFASVGIYNSAFSA